MVDGFRFAQPILHPHNDDIQRPETAVAEGELPASADIDGLSRFYLGVFQGMAIQARDGATKAELRGVVEAAMGCLAGRLKWAKIHRATAHNPTSFSTKA